MAQYVPVAGSQSEVQENVNISYVLRLHGIPMKWTSKITELVPKKYFVDEQLRVPYKIWHHKHIFIPMNNEVKNIKIIGTKFIANKNNNFLSFKLNLILNLEITNINITIVNIYRNRVGMGSLLI